jgi:hypothetical protein
MGDIYSPVTITEHRMKRVIMPVLFALLMCTCTSIASAQQTTGAKVDSVYDFSEGAMIGMDVEVRGAVHTPGKYRISTATKLEQLIAYAGGARADAELSAVRIVHDIRIDSTITEPVMVLNVAEYRATGNPLYNPLLYPFDVIVIPSQPSAIAPSQRYEPQK